MKTTTTTIEIRPAIAAVIEKRFVLEVTQRELLLLMGAVGGITPSELRGVADQRGFVLGDVKAIGTDLGPLFKDLLRAATESTK